MANNNSLFTFLAGAAVGVAAALLAKADKEKLNAALDKLESAIKGDAPAETVDNPVEETENDGL